MCPQSGVWTHRSAPRVGAQSEPRRTVLRWFFIPCSPVRACRNAGLKIRLWKSLYGGTAPSRERGQEEAAGRRGGQRSSPPGGLAGAQALCCSRNGRSARAPPPAPPRAGYWHAAMASELRSGKCLLAWGVVCGLAVNTVFL